MWYRAGKNNDFPTSFGRGSFTQQKKSTKHSGEK